MSPYPGVELTQVYEVSEGDFMLSLSGGEERRLGCEGRGLKRSEGVRVGD